MELSCTLEYLYICMHIYILLLFIKSEKVESRKLQYCWLVNKKEDSDFEIRKTSNFKMQLLKKSVSGEKQENKNDIPMYTIIIM